MPFQVKPPNIFINDCPSNRAKQYFPQDWYDSSLTELSMMDHLKKYQINDACRNIIIRISLFNACLRADLVPRMSLYLGESEVCIIRVHASYLFSSRSTKNLPHNTHTYFQTKQNRYNIQGKEMNIHRSITLIISTSWSTAFSPGNNGCRKSTLTELRKNI